MSVNCHPGKNIKRLLLLGLLVLMACVQAPVASAAQTVWRGTIPGNGRQVGPINLKRGATYYIQVDGSMYFGRWSVNKRSLNNDACYEFTARGRPVPMSILRNNLGINYCPGRYSSRHGYRSANFVSNGSPLYFRIIDSDYRDNRGGLRVTVVYVGGGR